MEISLALGKFTPLNFSRFSKGFSLVELDLVQFFKWEPRDQKRFREWIVKKSIQVIPRVSLRTQRNEEEFAELFLAAIESFGPQLRFFLIASGRKFFDLTRDARMLRELKELHSRLHPKIGFEWGEEDRTKTMDPLVALFPESCMVFDLDHHAAAIRAWRGPCHFKLHGWHPERWMRRYGEGMSNKLIKRINAKEQSILILSHSGRVEEAGVFLRAIEGRTG